MIIVVMFKDTAKTENKKTAFFKGANLLRICAVLLHAPAKRLIHLALSLVQKTGKAQRFALVDSIGLMSVFMVKMNYSSSGLQGVREKAVLNHWLKTIYKHSYWREPSR